jgi:cobalt/nickel transport system ATP-binding protein
MTPCALECHDLHYHYPDGTAALHDVNMRVAEGEAVAIVGANGAGKSTLLLQMAGCLRPTGGHVHVGDVAIAAQTLPRVRRAIGLLMQDPDDQLFMPTVAEDVAFGPLNLGLTPEAAAARAAAALRGVGAERLGERPPYRLSHGEKRLAALAAVLAMGPEVLVLDEPSAGLDPRARRQLIELLRGLQQARILATHDLDLVLDVCGRTIILDHGRIAADGATTALLSDAKLLNECGLELPLRLQGCAEGAASASGGED